MAYHLLVLDKDKFACVGELIFFYTSESLPVTSLKIDEGAAGPVYAIALEDFLTQYQLPDNISFVPFRELISRLNSEQANQLSKAIQLLRWRDEHQYCSRCGHTTKPHAHEYSMICSHCDYHQYPRVQPCIITAIVKHIDQKPYILLAHHLRAKDSKMYTVIAGFVEVGESLEQCVHREVMEEVGLTVGRLQYFGSQPWPFPSNLMVGFVAEYLSGDIKIDKTELTDAQFFALDELDKADSPMTPSKGTIAYDLIDFVKHHYQTN